MSATQQPRTSGLAGVEDTVKDFWSSRPRRPRRGRKIAGVAAGIANRYQIDPTIVRIALVIAAIYGGAGVVFYLLGWLLLPEQDDEVSSFESLLGRGRSSMSKAFAGVLCVALMLTVMWFLDGLFPNYLGLVILGVALLLLHRGRGRLPRQDTGGETTADTATPASDLSESPFLPDSDARPERTAPEPAGEPTATGDSTGDGTGNSARTGRDEPDRSDRSDTGYGYPAGTAVPAGTPDQPPAWDPLGAAPFAWDLPDPAPAPEQEPQPPRPRRKPRVTLMTLGVALVAGGAMAFLAPDVGWLSARHVAGVVLGILGLGMVAGSFLRTGRGLIALAVPVAVAGIGMTAVAPEGWRGVGDIREQPYTVAEVRDSYERSVGTIELDLTQLPGDETVDTRIDLGIGDITVIVPAEADVTASCRSDVGSVRCLERVASGTGNHLETGSDNGADGPGGLTVDLDIEIGTGDVEVRRG